MLHTNATREWNHRINNFIKVQWRTFYKNSLKVPKLCRAKNTTHIETLYHVY